MKVLHVVAARPNFMKIAPVMTALNGRGNRFRQVLVHTGQHYDDAMSRVFFDDLGLPRPDINLGVGSGSHTEQTAGVMLAFEPVLRDVRPDLVVVAGDVNSTFACALAAVRLGIPVAHVEAGLRSFDPTMPEEVNRVLTDRISELLFTTEKGAADNLAREGIDAARVHFVGNVMIDTLLRHRDRALALGMPARLGLSSGKYVLVTLHRPTNVDHAAVLGGILDALDEIRRHAPVVLPLHPRTRKMLQQHGLTGRLEAMEGILSLEPLGYLEFLALEAQACLVLTDSGGIQEETSILGVPCLTMRANTERPVTIQVGSNRLVGSDPVEIVTAAIPAIEGRGKKGRTPELWDGRAAERIAGKLEEWRSSTAPGQAASATSPG